MALACMRYTSLCPVKDSADRTRWQVRVSESGYSTLLPSSCHRVNGFSEKSLRSESLVADGRKEEEARSYVVATKEESFPFGTSRKLVKDAVANYMKLLWDDGYGTATVKDYLDGAGDILTPDGGPPRWFCPVECGEPLKGSPLLLYLPGLDGVGLGLVLHHKALGRVFEVRCLHIPLYDRTSFQGLVKMVEDAVLLEQSVNPNKPIYLVGDSFGGCLALAVAARNPEADLILILSNPATSINPSNLQPILLVQELISNELHFTIPYFLGLLIGNPLKLATVNIDRQLPLNKKMSQLSTNLLAMLPHLKEKSGIITRETLHWKLQLIESAASYANSRLHAVNAEVLVLASGNDLMLPSRDEAERLKRALQNCRVRHFKDNGHALLLEDGINLLTIIKGTSKYRRSRKVDYVSDFIPPSLSEFKQSFNENVRLLLLASSAAMFSTLEDGTIVRGLSGVPSQGPVILVGYHMLMGMELYSLVEHFLREKNIMLRGVAHPEIFANKLEQDYGEFSVTDWMKVMGAVPVSGAYLYKLLGTDSHVLLYPGGAREALHYKGEEYKLFWPDRAEFVRMAAKFGATIVPFGVVGEDELVEYALDFHDLAKIPGFVDYIRDLNKGANVVRDESEGEVANRDLSVPLMLPKLPGRLYFMFGKPIRMDKSVLNDRAAVNQMYSHIKSQVETNIAYLLNKRGEDPYRNIVDRTVYRVLHFSSKEVPAFKP